MILFCLTRLIFLKLKNKSLNLFINGSVKDLTITLTYSNCYVALPIVYTMNKVKIIPDFVKSTLLT